MEPRTFRANSTLITWRKFEMGEFKRENVPEISGTNMGGSMGFHKWGIPNSWMVYFMESPRIKWMIWHPHFRKPPHV